MSNQITSQNAKTFIAERLAALLEASPTDIDPSIEFDHFGLDSAKAVELTADISDWTGIELDPTILYDYPTINGLSVRLVELTRPSNVEESAEDAGKVSV